MRAAAIWPVSGSRPVTDSYVTLLPRGSRR